MDPLEPPPKRARTEDSVMSTNSVEATSVSTNGATQNGLKLKASGAAALKPNEIALEQIAGKKRSKFWVYAVEPVAADLGESSNNGTVQGETNGNGNGNTSHRYTPSPPRHNNGKRTDFSRSLEGSLSPMYS